MRLLVVWSWFGHGLVMNPLVKTGWFMELDDSEMSRWCLETARQVGSAEGDPRDPMPPGAADAMNETYRKAIIFCQKSEKYRFF